MAYRIEAQEPLEAALRRIALEQTVRAIREIDDSRDPLATIHIVRKRCKKIRGLLRLVRDGLDEYAFENRAVRDAARPLAEFRDSEIVLETYDALVGRAADALDVARFAAVRAEADASGTMRHAERALAGFRASMTAFAGRIDGWTLNGDPASIVRRGMKRTYARARDACKTAARTRAPADHHEWRKRVKYHGCHLRLLGAVGGAELAARLEPVRALDESLGDAHDYAVLESWLERVRARDHTAAVEVVCALAMRERLRLESAALDNGRSLFSITPKRVMQAAPRRLAAAASSVHGAPPGSA